jgi:hypothetical protein
MEQAKCNMGYHEYPEGSLHNFSKGSAMIAEVRIFLFDAIDIFGNVHDLLF